MATSKSSSGIRTGASARSLARRVPTTPGTPSRMSMATARWTRWIGSGGCFSATGTAPSRIRRSGISTAIWRVSTRATWTGTGRSTWSRSGGTRPRTRNRPRALFRWGPVGDIDGDGRDDVLTYGRESFRVQLSNGDGSFRRATQESYGPGGFVLADRTNRNPQVMYVLNVPDHDEDIGIVSLIENRRSP